MTTWINQPGNYSGDTWHIAAAMVLCDTISLVQTVCKRDDRTAQQAREFYYNIGINESRVLTVPLETCLEHELRLSQAVNRIKYNQRHKQIAYETLKKVGYPNPNLCYVYQATALYLQEASRKIHSTIPPRDAFTKSLGNDFPNVIKAIEDLTNNIDSKAVLIMGRYAPYLKEYDADYSKTSTIVKLAHDHNRPCYLVANTSNPDARKISKQLSISIIDPYSLHKDIDNISGTGRVDMRGTAYFWKHLSKKGRDNLVIGGRSGSVDIAAYIGMNTVEWDIFNPYDPESLRLAYMSPSICSTINISKDHGFDHKSHYQISLPGNTTTKTIKMSARNALKHRLNGKVVTFKHTSKVKKYVRI